MRMHAVCMHMYGVCSTYGKGPLVSGGSYCSESVWSCLTVSADRWLSEVKHTHICHRTSMGSIQITTGLNENLIELKWAKLIQNQEAELVSGKSRRPRRKITRWRMRSGIVVYPLKSFQGSSGIKNPPKKQHLARWKAVTQLTQPPKKPLISACVKF